MTSKRFVKVQVLALTIEELSANQGQKCNGGSLWKPQSTELLCRDDTQSKQADRLVQVPQQQAPEAETTPSTSLAVKLSNFNSNIGITIPAGCAQVSCFPSESMPAQSWIALRAYAVKKAAQVTGGPLPTQEGHMLNEQGTPVFSSSVC